MTFTKSQSCFRNHSTWENSHFLSSAFESFAESVQPPVCPSEVQGRRVTAKSFPLFGLNLVKTSQEARGLIRCGDTIAAGGVTRKPTDSSLNITHTSYDLTSGQAAGAWSLLCLQGRYVFSHRLKWKAHTNAAHAHTHTHTHTLSCMSTYSTNIHPYQHAAIYKLIWSWKRHYPEILSHVYWHMMLFTRSHSCDEPTATQVSDALYQLTTKEEERLCPLYFPLTFHSITACVWKKKTNNGANVSLFSSLSREQAAPLCMPLLFSEWCRAPQQHCLRKSVSLNTWFVFVAATGGAEV